jgi:hypothetical protein
MAIDNKTYTVTENLDQGQIKVFGGPRPDKLRGPSPPLLFSFSFYKVFIGSLRSEDITPGKKFEIIDGCRRVLKQSSPKTCITV